MTTRAVKPKITHILADGREVDDIKGHIIGKENEAFYQIVKDILEGKSYEKSQKIL